MVKNETYKLYNMSVKQLSYANERWFSYIVGNITYQFKYGVLETRKQRNGNKWDAIIYHPNGKIKSICSVTTDDSPKCIGICLSYDENENLISKRNFDTEDYIDYYPDGKEIIKEKGKMTHEGKKCGYVSIYDIKGVLIKDMEYKDDKFTGNLKTYYSNGNIE